MIQPKETVVEEYLELKKNIRGNLLSERTGEQELQTDLSEFYRPITETQKATTREIREGLKPIKEGIENLPSIQPIKKLLENIVTNYATFLGRRGNSNGRGSEKRRGGGRERKINW